MLHEEYSVNDGCWNCSHCEPGARSDKSGMFGFWGGKRFPYCLANMPEFEGRVVSTYEEAIIVSREILDHRDKHRDSCEWGGICPLHEIKQDEGDAE